MKKTNSNSKNVFQDDIVWSVRFLSIYSIPQPKAVEIVNRIVEDLSQISWSAITDGIRKELFMSKLRTSILDLKSPSYS